MMENKPLITYAGELPVFEGVVPSLQKGIGTEAVEWKRAYGRSTKHVHLHPRFIPFDPDLPQEVSLMTSLLDQPMLHTFWTDCADVELYRSTTKDGIQSWLNSVKGCNVKEWLIILVEPADNKKTNKLLPRSSVLDKIKNDFAQKQTERCVCLSDPQKLDSKSAESLHSMLHRIRQLLLASYSKTLTKFEENMRAQREKRTELGWNFCHYFLLQEELAFVLEMLEVYDEALVQYDELDALFTQFVLNSHLTDTPQWLLSFQRYGDRWPALNLSNGSASVLSKIRDTIRNSSVSLLNFRNYLFARQAILLVKQRRINELAQRSLAFLHNCINELVILDVAFSEEGSISCWVFVSCLEILATICGHGQASLTRGTTNNINPSLDVVDSGSSKVNGSNSNGEVGDKHMKINQHNSSMLASDFSVHTASLWDYAREKLYELGKVCGLLPKSQLKSDHLHKVISLAAGLVSFEGSDFTNGNCRQKEEADLTEELPQEETETPIEKLKNALSSKEKFQHHYLELCELAMGTYKHIGRLRSARKVGLSLASYYMEAEDFGKAVVFLAEALKTFKDDKWEVLVLDVLLKLAQSYQAMNDMDRYIRVCAQIACSKALDGPRRNHFFDEMMTRLTENESKDTFIISPTEETFVIKSVKIETLGKLKRNYCEVKVTLNLVSNLPRPVLSNSVQMAILPCDHFPKVIGFSTSGAFISNAGGASSNNTNSGSGNRSNNKSNQNKKGRGGSSSSVDNNSNRKNSKEGPNFSLNSGSGSNNVGDNNNGVKERLTRKESTTPLLTCEDEDTALAIMELNPAVLKLDFSQQLETKQQDKTVQGGRLMCHDTHQSLTRKDSQVKGEVQVSKTDFSEAAKSTDIIINPGSNRIELQAKVSTPGSYRLGQVAIDVKHFELLSPRMGCRYRFTVEKVCSKIELASTTLLAGIEQCITVNVFTGSHYINDVPMALNVRASSIGLQLKLSDESELCSEISLPLSSTDSFSTCAVSLRVKAELGPQKDSTAIEHKLMARCPWTNEEKKLTIAFVPPFMSSHKLHSVGKRKFIQVMLQGLSEASFKVFDHQLTIQHAKAEDIPLVSLNPRSQSLVLNTGRHAAYMWELGITEWNDEHPLRAEFCIKYQLDSHNPELYKYYICLQRFRTQFELKSKVEPHKGSEFCRVANMCTMVLEISKVGEEAHKSLMYEVRADQHMWAICGRSSGVVSMEECGTQEVTLDVMPMSPGYLPLPTVHLSKYIPSDQKGGNSSVPKLEPFNGGQVYNRSKGSQVHVLPPPQSIGNATGGGGSLPITSDAHY